MRPWPPRTAQWKQRDPRVGAAPFERGLPSSRDPLGSPFPCAALVRSGPTRLSAGRAAKWYGRQGGGGWERCGAHVTGDALRLCRAARSPPPSTSPRQLVAPVQPAPAAARGGAGQGRGEAPQGSAVRRRRRWVALRSPGEAAAVAVSVWQHRAGLWGEFAVAGRVLTGGTVPPPRRFRRLRWRSFGSVCAAAAVNAGERGDKPWRKSWRGAAAGAVRPPARWCGAAFPTEPGGRRFPVVRKTRRKEKRLLLQL